MRDLSCKAITEDPVSYLETTEKEKSESDYETGCVASELQDFDMEESEDEEERISHDFLYLARFYERLSNGCNPAQ